MFFNLAKGMLKLGHEVHIICHKKKRISNHDTFLPSSDIGAIEELGAIVHYVKPEQEDKGKISSGGTIYKAIKMHMGYALNALRVANQLANNVGIDIIHANMYTPVIPAAIFGKIRHIPVVMTLHNPTIDIWKEWSLQEGVPRSTSFIGPIYEKFILKMPVSMVHVESEKVKDQLKQINPKAKSVLIYNGVELFEEQSPQLELLYDKYVLYMGRLVTGKNLQTVILAFKEVVQIMPDARMFVIGDGPMRQEWQKLVDMNNLASNILFLGHISDKKTKDRLLVKSSAVVFPSVSEGFALVPIEAFEMSKPVLISNVRPSDEIVDDNIDGFLIPPHDPSRWADRILFLLKNPDICKSMGVKGRRKVLETFNMTAVASNMEQLYQRLVSKSGQA